MTTTKPKPTREMTFRGDLDVPPGLPKGIDLGRIANKDKAIAMYGREMVETLTDHALLADDYAYQAMLDFKDKSNTTSWRTFDRALENGIDSIDDPTPGLVAIFEQLDRVPEWVDFDQLYRGAVAFWRAGPIVPPVLAWGAIAGGFSMYSATRPVLFSGRLRKMDQVGTRLIESFRYVVAAYTPGGMRRYEEGFRLTAKVRMIHAAVRHSLGSSDAWDWANWGIPINNLDGMVTQAGQFGVKFIDAVQSSGIRYSDRELEDIFALSRYVGYVIGVPEDILHTDYEDGDVASTAKQDVVARHRPRITAGTVDGDDLGTHVGEQHPRERARTDTCELDHPHTVERCRSSGHACDTVGIPPLLATMSACTSSGLATAISLLEPSGSLIASLN